MGAPAGSKPDGTCTNGRGCIGGVRSMGTTGSAGGTFLQSTQVNESGTGRMPTCTSQEEELSGGRAQALKVAQLAAQAQSGQAC